MSCLVKRADLVRIDEDWQEGKLRVLKEKIIRRNYKKKICFNCIGTKNRASDCLSNRPCLKFKGKDHSPICEKATTIQLATSICSVTYPVVLIEIKGVSAVPL